MGIACDIHYNQNNEIEYINLPNGERSVLFDELKNLFGAEKALDLYALTETDNFKTIYTAPTIKDVITYATSTQEQLTTEQKQSVIESGVSNNYELFTQLQQAFLDDNNVVIFNKTKLKKAGYNDYEITAILSNKELQNSIKDNIFKVNNSEFNVDYNGEELKYSDELTIFGKQKVYIEVKEEGVNEIINGEIQPKKSDTLQTLRKTYPINSEPVSQKLDMLFSSVFAVTENVAQRNNTELKDVAKGIETEVVKYGIDLRGIEDKVLPLNQFKSFIGSLEAYIKNPNDNFSEIYDNFFNISAEEPQDLGNDIKLDTELTEYELFRDHNLIRKEGDVYTKVVPENIEDLYNYFFKQQKELKTKEQVQAKVSEMQVEDEVTESDILEAMYIWKNFLNAPIKTKSNKKPSFVNLSEAINNPFLKATSKGIQLVSNDPITKAKADLYKEEIVQEESFNTEDELRSKIFKGEIVAPKITTNYTILEDGVLLTKNNTNQFLSTNQANYEMIYQEGNISFYKEVEAEEKTFSDININRYLNESTFPDTYTEIKKENLKEAESKYFNCQ